MGVDDNPFIGTKQLDCLKIVVMLLSNWDSKDRRDVSRGSNTAIFEHRISPFAYEARYLIIDWGGAMGEWGTRSSRAIAAGSTNVLAGSRNRRCVRDCLPAARRRTRQRGLPAR